MTKLTLYIYMKKSTLYIYLKKLTLYNYSYMKKLTLYVYTRNTCMQQPLAINYEHATIFSELHEVLA